MSTESATNGTGIRDVECPACGSEQFNLKDVDEHGNDNPAVYVFCARCGNSTGRIEQATVDNRIADSGASRTDSGEK